MSKPFNNLKLADLLPKIDYRAEILNGNLPLPQQIIDFVGEQAFFEMEALFASLWHNYLSSKSSISVPFWSDKFQSKHDFVNFTRHLAKAGWTINTVIPARRWGEIMLNEKKILKYVSASELESVRLKFKFKKYMPSLEKSIADNITKVDGKLMDSGLKRPGFAMAGNSRYMLDTEAIKANYDVIAKQLTKSMDKLAIKYDCFKDSLTYADVSIAILEDIIANPDRIYTTGANINDSRGRAISSVMKQVFNPISSKEARSCLIILNPKVCHPSEVKYAYRFIAEMLGHKLASPEAKAIRGFKAFTSKELLTLDAGSEDDRKEWHVNIWLKRLYAELELFKARDVNKNFSFSVPIESDSSASMLSYLGLLLNHQPFLEMTNCLDGDMVDPWGYTNIPREQFKKAMTPILYGSGEKCQNLWAHRNIPFTKEDVDLFNEELNHGVMAPAKAFRDFIVNNVNPAETMEVTIWGETFTIKCNKYKSVGDYIVSYSCYDSKSNLVQTINHTHTSRVPDLNRFKLFFVTLLIHNLDSRVMDYASLQICLDNGFCIPIHDAMIHDIADSSRLRIHYAYQMTKIGEDRVSILKEYFSSIGITDKVSIRWSKVQKLCTPLVGKFKCSLNALK